MLQKATLEFIKELGENNDKSWFDANRKRYDTARADFDQLITKVIEGLAKSDIEIAWLKAKDCIFRINRDIRFTKDKAPYKDHMGASLNKAGRSSHFADYYFHCQPGNKSLVGGGLWLPEAKQLKQVRQEIDYCYDEFKCIITSKEFIKEYGNLEMNSYTLSRPPKGYEKDNPAIEYLKLKSIMCFTYIKDEELMSKDLVTKIVNAFKALQPLVKFINRAMEE
ncbi:MAG: hypothetical protein JWQ96_3418 [Segetibacter sp.]|nr:hypothetical protein [Segetibacter sp.]